MYLLGIDIGTSSCKAAVFDLDGHEIASADGKYNVYYGENGAAEQDVNEWYAAVCGMLREITNKVGAKNIAGVGIDGISWTSIMLDSAGEALCRTPIWFDTRAVSECEDLKTIFGEDKLFELCGNPITPTYTTPKFLWFKKNAPEIYKETWVILQSNSYIAYRLTGVYSHDYSQGYGHFFFDMKNRCYNTDLIREMGLEPSHYANLCNSSDIIGYVSKKAAEETGLLAGTPVAAGGLDAACGTLGTGVYKPGQTQEQSGTAGGMSICVSKALAHRSLILGAHVVNDVYLLQGGTSGGGGVMQWFADNYGTSFKTGDEKSVLAAIDHEAEKIAAGCDGVIFLPYMAGERSPLWNPDAVGVY